ncbi:hypothetical protein ALO41_200289 [Pseudomonas amygdali pv. ulmi]|uniref:Transposase n=1 Tax=Pseudomonas amygdali pv. ulmi TaxID=251720 RepID=A0A0Q0E4L0_PSEA0|nr:hypothetical protein [Pseudomonas amygdali]KPZ05574.1 hypothetical protein ALO41_200289 [Pseudomonas amygdali pv. ulmi]KWS15017.1 hypothetical protein AL065_03895 [Pseudomonas amygdali pv. ulmi]
MRERKIYVQVLLVALAQFVLSSPARADVFKSWMSGNFPKVSFETPERFCEAWYSKVIGIEIYNPANNYYESPIHFSCGEHGFRQTGAQIDLLIVNCLEGQWPNEYYTGCEYPSSRSTKEPLIYSIFRPGNALEALIYLGATAGF